jgi:DNA-binding CsgD family transcriptional regulator
VSSPAIQEGHAALRDGDAAAAHCERAYAAYRRERDPTAAGRAARTASWITGNVLGDWAVRGGWLARARSILQEAGGDGPEHGWVLLISAFTEPDPRVRESLLREAIAVGRRVGDPDIEFEALSYLGGLYVMTDRVEEGMRCLHEALAGFGRAQLPMELARTRLELARALADRSPEAAVAEAKAALQGFEQLEAARHAATAAALLRSLGALARVGPKGSRALTRREAEVLRLVGAGLSNPEIGDRLYITRKTVEHQVGSVLAKLGLRNRAEAAAYATRQQLGR